MAFESIPRHAFNRILEARPDPLDILKTTAQVAASMRHVSISMSRTQTIGQVLSLRSVAGPPWNHEYHFFDGTERTLIYLLLLDALNFSFWGAPRWTVNFHGASTERVLGARRFTQARGGRASQPFGSELPCRDFARRSGASASRSR